MNNTPITVRVTRAFACPAEQVFDAWLDPALARQFLFATPPTGKVIRCDIEPNIGGRFVIVDRRPADGDQPAIDAEHHGRYLQIDRPRRLAFSFSVPQYSAQETTVTLDLEPQGDGCELTLRHDLGTSEEAQQNRERTEQGWGMVLENLGQALQKQ